MNAETYLARIEAIDSILKINSEEVAILRSKAEALTGAVDRDRVRTSKTVHDRMAEMIAEYVDLQNDIVNESLALEAERQGIINTIKMLVPEECDLLYAKYVKGLMLQDIADEFRIAYSTARTRHTSAIAHIQEILNEREAEV